MKTVLIVGFIVVGAGVGYYFYDRNQKKKTGAAAPQTPVEYPTQEVVEKPFDELAYVIKVRQEVRSQVTAELKNLQKDIQAQLADCKKVVAGEMTKLDYNIKYPNIVNDFERRIKEIEIALKVIEAEIAKPNREADFPLSTTLEKEVYNFVTVNEYGKKTDLKGISLL